MSINDYYPVPVVIEGYRFVYTTGTTDWETFSEQEARENARYWRKHPNKKWQKVICCSD
jgi:hypothetical protein